MRVAVNYLISRGVRSDPPWREERECVRGDTDRLSSLYQIETRVRAALDTRLPGADAHLPLAPRPRRGWRPGLLPPNARVAAGLVLLYPSTSDSDTVRLVLTVRAGELGQHADQVSLPGGSVDPGEGVQEAALRESSEEIGVDPTLVRVVGVLSRLYIPVSDFVLHPVVGMAHSRPAFQPSTEEVARILEVPLEELTTDGPRRGYRWRNQQRIQVPYFELGGERVWGATAMVLSELRAAIGVPAEDPWGVTIQPDLVAGKTIAAENHPIGQT